MPCMSNRHKGRKGFDRLVRATGHSVDGLVGAYRSESAFRQELWLSAALVPAALYLGANWAERAVLVMSVILVLVTELLNSAVEATVDRISFDDHELSKRAKDYGSAAVLVALLLCAGLMLSAFVRRLIA